MNRSFHSFVCQCCVIHSSLRYSAQRNDALTSTSVAIATGSAMSRGMTSTRGCQGGRAFHTRSLCFWYRASETKIHERAQDEAQAHGEHQRA